jgi:hypothetical protein
MAKVDHSADGDSDHEANQKIRARELSANGTDRESSQIKTQPCGATTAPEHPVELGKRPEQIERREPVGIANPCARQVSIFREDDRRSQQRRKVRQLSAVSVRTLRRNVIAEKSDRVRRSTSSISAFASTTTGWRRIHGGLLSTSGSDDGGAKSSTEGGDGCMAPKGRRVVGAHSKLASRPGSDSRVVPRVTAQSGEDGMPYGRHQHLGRGDSRPLRTWSATACAFP